MGKPRSIEVDMPDPRFGQLDRSGLVDLTKPSDEASFLDERFGISLPDAIAQLADSDEEIRDVLRQGGVLDGSTPQQFRTRVNGTSYAGTVHFADGAWRFEVEADGGERLEFTIAGSATDDLDSVKTQGARYLANENSGIRESLEQFELLSIARRAQAGDIAGAIAEFLEHSLPGVKPTPGVITDPKYRAVCDTAVWYAFRTSQTALSDEGFPEFLKIRRPLSWTPARHHQPLEQRASSLPERRRGASGIGAV